MMKNALAVVVALTLTSPAAAQNGHGDHKGPSGGQMIDVAGVEAELLTSANTITITVFDESHEPLATKGFTASALVVRGSKREILLWLPQAKTRSRVSAKSRSPGPPSGSR